MRGHSGEPAASQTSNPDAEERPLPTSLLSRLDVSYPRWLAVALLALLSTSCGQRTQDGAAAGPTPQAAASSASPIPWATVQPPTQVGGSAGAPAAQTARAPVRTFHGAGVVRSINLKEGWFEIDHEDIKDYMPAMRMQWRVRESATLKSVQVGDKVDFTLEEDNGSEVITELKKSSERK